MKTDKIKEVYEKYAHMDEVISDVQWLKEDIKSQMVYDLWKAVKEAAQSAE